MNRGNDDAMPWEQSIEWLVELQRLVVKHSGTGITVTGLRDYSVRDLWGVYLHLLQVDKGARRD